MFLLNGQPINILLSQANVYLWPVKNPQWRQIFKLLWGFCKSIGDIHKSNLQYLRIFEVSVKTLRTILTLSIALLVLISSSSFTINMHFCMGKVHSLAVIEKAAPCPMELKVPSCHKVKKASCCDDEQLTFEGKDFKAQESFSLEVASHNWVADLPVIFEINRYDASTNALITSHLYKPPLLHQDIPVLIQSFLI